LTPAPEKTEGTDVEGKPITYAEIRAWVSTVRHGNFTKAAHALGMQPVTLQNLVRRLQGKVQRRLGSADLRLYHYDATTRLITPTESGRRLNTWAESAVANIEGVEDFLKRELVEGDGSLCVAANLALLEHRLLGVAAQIRSERKGTAVQMVPAGSEGAERKLRQHEVHVAFCGAFEGWPTIEESVAETFPRRTKALPYDAVPVTLFVPAGHRFLGGDFEAARRAAEAGDEQARRKVLRDIRDSGHLMLPGRFSRFRHQLEQVFAESGAELDPDHIQEFDVGRLLLVAVSTGLGITIQQQLFEASDPSLDVRAIPLSPWAVPRWRYVALYHELHLTEGARDFLRRTCGADL